MQIRSEASSGARWWSLRWWMQDGRWLTLAVPLLLVMGHFTPWAARYPVAALPLALAAALLLAGALASPQLRRELDGVRGLDLPAVLFGLTLLVVVWSLTPWAPGGPHPVWSYIGITPAPRPLGAPATTMDKSATTVELFKLIGLSCVFGLGVILGASDSRARLAAHVFAVVAGGFALWSFITFVSERLAGGTRLGAAFDMPNVAATLFGASLMVAIGVAVSRIRSAPPRGRFAAAAPLASVCLAIFVALLATASRGGFLSTATGLAAFVALLIFGGALKLSRGALISVAGAALLVALLAIAGDQLVGRIGLRGWADDDRAVLLAVHWEAFKAAPLMGYGLGAFDAINRTLLNAENIEAIWPAREAHNVYLSWLEQTGVFGAIPMFATLAAILAATARNALRRTRLTPILFGLLSASVVFLAHGVTDFALEAYSIAATWSLLLGLGFSASQGASAR